MGRLIAHDFNDGHGLNTTQQDRLGLWLPDEDRLGWYTYGQFYENVAMKTGQVIRHAGPADLIKNSGVGTLTKAQPKGGHELEDTDEFDGKDLVGAIGHIYDGTGEGQVFYIEEMVNKSVVLIRVICGQTGRPYLPGADGWQVALDTTSLYRLWFPGRFYQGDGGAADLVAGIIQTDVTPTASYKPFGLVKSEGPAYGLLNVADPVAHAQNGFVKHIAGGLVASIASFGRTAIGHWDTAPNDTTADSLVPLTLKYIARRRASFRFGPQSGHVLNRNTTK